jgi:hypothetical protein
MLLRSLQLCAFLAFIPAEPAYGGPPWISVELPANPHHESTRNASLLVRAYHHSSPLVVSVTAVAEGIVDGRRVSRKLDLRATNQTGVYAVHSPLPTGGTWILAFTIAPSANASATALVTVDPQGRVVSVDVPADRMGDGWLVPRRVQQKDIEAALRVAQIAHGGGTDRLPVRALALPLLLLGGAVAAGAARRR